MTANSKPARFLALAAAKQGTTTNVAFNALSVYAKMELSKQTNKMLKVHAATTPLVALIQKRTGIKAAAEAVRQTQTAAKATATVSSYDNSEINPQYIGADIAAKMEQMRKHESYGKIKKDGHTLSAPSTAKFPTAEDSTLRKITISVAVQVLCTGSSNSKWQISGKLEG
ncbi:hypothetical protein DPX39_090089800 [Trypanosoma brucei equiperdum]|uniref:Uncharacterized protein n=1 Tax=Trypanosoma brucei equiperdum TaxID=630700 RepID=A0A3L6L8H5_9TRYP|nr:hypothetical protein DPX39_090089800 [Trypanosoma brucei equiperdum]